MKTDKDIENLLMSGKKLSLSTHEKESIKTTLLEHARETLKHDTRAIPSPWTSWVFRGSVSFASLLIVFVGTAYASQDSLPGEPLYAMKVHVVEEMVAFSKMDPSEHIAYDISLMETRLAELQILAVQKEIPESDDLEVISDQIDEHIDDIAENLSTADNSTMTHEEKIDILAKLSSVSKAQSKVTRNEARFVNISNTVSDSHESTTDALESAVDDFVEEESIEAVGEYLSDQITEVGEQVSASTTNEGTRDSARRHLYDVDEALVDGDTAEAIVSILEAQQEIDSEEYLDEDPNTEGEITN